MWQAERPPKVAILTFEGANSYLLALPIQVFRELVHADGLPHVELRVCALHPGRVRLDAAFPLEVTTPYGLEALEDADVALVPTWRDMDAPIPEALCQALRRAHQRGALVAGLCRGVFVLAAAGLLDGRAATTMSGYLDELTRRFPRVKVKPDVLYVHDERLTTGAGRASAMDACLALVQRLFGDTVADEVARRLVSAPAHHAEEAQHTQRRQPLAGPDARIMALTSWLKAHLGETHSVHALAVRVNMTDRSFVRHFNRLLMVSPARWLARERLAWARTLLETGDLNVEAVARMAGFASAQSLRRLFHETYGTSPATVRRTSARHGRHPLGRAAKPVGLVSADGGGDPA